MNARYAETACSPVVQGATHLICTLQAMLPAASAEPRRVATPLKHIVRCFPAHRESAGRGREPGWGSSGLPMLSCGAKLSADSGRWCTHRCVQHNLCEPGRLEQIRACDTCVQPIGYDHSRATAKRPLKRAERRLPDQHICASPESSSKHVHSVKASDAICQAVRSSLEAPFAYECRRGRCPFGTSPRIGTI